MNKAIFIISVYTIDEDLIISKPLEYTEDIAEAVEEELNTQCYTELCKGAIVIPIQAGSLIIPTEQVKKVKIRAVHKEIKADNYE